LPERDYLFFKDRLWIHPQSLIQSLSATATLFFKLTLSLQNITLSPCVNKIFSEKKLMAQAGIVPVCKHNFVSKTRANQFWAMRCHFAPVSTSAPKRGKTPENGIIIEIEKSD